MVLFVSFALKYASNVTVKGTTMETAIPPKTCVSLISPIFVAMYTKLTEIFRIIEEQMNTMSINLVMLSG